VKPAPQTNLSASGLMLVHDLPSREQPTPVRERAKGSRTTIRPEAMNDLQTYT
jgi:hypothetical protein